MEITQCLIGDIKILEPITALTDLIVTVVCVYAFFKLKKISNLNNGYMKYYPYFFLMMGLGTFFAALFSHAFQYWFVDEIVDPKLQKFGEWQQRWDYNIHNLPNWIFNVISVTLFEFAVIHRGSRLISNFNYNIYKICVIAESLIVTAILLYLLNYNIAAAHIGIALYVFSMPIQLKVHRQNNSQEAKYLIIGSILMLITLPVMALKYQISPWFNHNDISHTAIAITMYLFYLSAQIAISDSKPNLTEKS